MADQMTPTHSRDAGDSNEMPAKRIKTSDDSTAVTKFMDINIDCLENIFKHLSLSDLLNVADSSKQLKPAADLTFKSKYGKSAVVIFSVGRCRSKKHRCQKEDSKIHGGCMTFWLKFLRCFGHLVSKLENTPYVTDSVLWAEIDRYINEYCAESLIEIEFAKSHDESMKEMKKPFSKAEIVCFSTYTLGSHLSDFSKWFPKMRRLQLNGCRVSNRNGIVAHFPHLKHLTINTETQHVLTWEYTNINDKMVAEILRLNPALHSLYTMNGAGIDAKYYQGIGEHLQSLESLEIDMDSKFLNLHDGTVHVKNLKKLKINYKSFAPIEEITFSFDGLEEVTFKSSAFYGGNVSYALSHMFMDFISKQQSLTKLSLACHTYPGSVTFFLSEYSKFKLALPSLKEAILKNCIFTADETVAFLHKCPLLTKFCFKYAHEGGKACFNSRGEKSCKHLDKIQQVLGNEWHTSIDENDYVELSR